MWKYATRRVLTMIPILIGVSMVVFLLVASLPGDAVDAQAGGNISAEKIEQNKALLGLDKPIPERYVNWASHAIRGDFGISISYKIPVTEVIGKFVWNSFLVAAVAFILQLLIAIPIGVISATKQYSIFDNTFSVVAFAGISLPSFFLAMILRHIFSVKLGVLPLDGMVTAGANNTGGAYVVDVLLHMILPVVTLTVIQLGGTMRYVRTSMLEVINQDYIRTARAKGLPEKVVIYKHALKNAMIPIVTYVGGAIPALFAGAMITETVFAWPGIGKVFLDSIGKRDYLFMMGFAMFLSVLTMVGNLISDLLYGAVDPRIRLK